MAALSMVLLFYKYVWVEDPAGLVAAQKRLCGQLGLKGRVLIASEGINGTLQGPGDALATYVQEMRDDARFADIAFKRGETSGDSFPRLSVKLRQEIVSLHLKDDVDVGAGGAHLSPAEWRRRVEDPEVVILDVRNRYEYAVGHFAGAIDARIENFRELPDVLERFKDWKEKEILMYCTGGVRCEKASALFKREGFQRVYQLAGGILSYVQEFPEDGRWLGDCFVFDQRMVDPVTTARIPVGVCEHTAEPTRHFVNCGHAPCHRLFLVALPALERNPELALCGDCRAGGLTLATADKGGRAAARGPRRRHGNSKKVDFQSAFPRQVAEGNTLGALDD